MSKSTVVLTMPISPPEVEKQGILSLCMISSVLSKKMGADAYLCLNLNNSYRDKDVSKNDFLKSLGQVGLGGERIWEDSLDQSHVLNNINRLMERGDIFSKEVASLVCGCGRVDCKEESLEHIKDTKLISKRDGDLFCNVCDTKCETVTVEALVFRVPDIDYDVKTVPGWLEKEMKELHRKFVGAELMISKVRPTSLTFDIGEKKFNIDNDFCTFNYLSSFKQDRKVIVGGPKLAYQMYMMSIVDRVCNPNSETAFVAIARINGESKLVTTADKPGVLGKKLFLMSAFNLTKEVKWAEGEINFVSRKPDELLGMIDKKISEFVPAKEGEVWSSYLERVLQQEMKVQKIKSDQVNIYKSKGSGAG